MPATAVSGCLLLGTGLISTDYKKMNKNWNVCDSPVMWFEAVGLVLGKVKNSSAASFKVPRPVHGRTHSQVIAKHPLTLHQYADDMSPSDVLGGVERFERCFCVNLRHSQPSKDKDIFVFRLGCGT